MLESNPILDESQPSPASPVPSTTESPFAGPSSQNEAAVQLLEHGTGSGVVKKPAADRWARSRAKASGASETATE